ncbi:MAG: dTMP kinase [Thermodesulfobacteriota bacterium]
MHEQATSGLFITLEGVEGSGKTTQAPHLVAFLKSRGYQVVRTREPGGTGMGKRIRSILLDPESAGMEPLAELLLYEADRAQHIRRVILPALSAGQAVVCDRFYDATAAYQGYARGLDLELVEHLNGIAAGSLVPDITILLDLPARVGVPRARSREGRGFRDHGREGRFEAESLEFHEKVREGYLALAVKHPERFVVIRADQDTESVRSDIMRAVEEYLENRAAAT